MKRVLLVIFAGVFTALIGITVFSVPSFAAADTVVAKAGSVTVTVAEIRRRVALLNPDSTAAQRNEFLGNADNVRELASTMVMNKLLLLEARNKKLEDQADTRDLITMSREDVLLRSLMNEVAPLSSIPAPTDKEQRDFYNANKASFAVGKQYKFSRIFVASPENRTAEQKKEAKRKIDECYADLKGAKAEQFSRSARICSEDTESRDKGGLVGWLAEDKIIPQFREVLVKMKVGEVSAPFQTSVGWHIFRLDETKPAGTYAFEDVKDAIIQRLKEINLQTKRQAYVDKLLQENKIEVKDDVLEAVKP